MSELLAAGAFDPHQKLGFAAPETIRRVQEQLLKAHLGYLAEHSPFYRRRLAEAGFDPAAPCTLADLQRLPLTGKEDLDRCNDELLCVPQEEIADLCLTSGTTGRPVPLPQTRRDLERLAWNEALSFGGTGIGRGDRVLVAAAIDRCFMAGMAYFLGLVRLGATVIRGGSSSIPALVELVRGQRPTAIVGVPSLLLALAGRLREAGLDPAACGVKRLVCIGEPVRGADLQLSALGRRLAASWRATVFGTYASTEMATAFTDCEKGRGGHLPPNLALVEIVDETGQPLPPGQPGEVVATPLQVTGMPLLRYRTGDIAVLHAEPCACGRQTPRLGPVLGRKAQMLKYRGTTVFPPAIFQVLQELEGVRGYYLEVFEDHPLSDRIRVVVGCVEATLRPAEIAERIAARIRVKPEVVLADPEAVQRRVLQPDQRKPVTFFDFRGKENQGET